LDIQFKLSQKPKFLDEIIPARARELTGRFTIISAPLFRSHKPLLEDEFLASSDGWTLELQTVFRTALEFVVQLRQREDRTDFVWPKYGSVYDKATMNMVTRATEDELEGKKVQLSLIPAAIGWLRNEDGESEMEVFSKAVVILDLESCGLLR
jgi:hypothetical protein